MHFLTLSNNLFFNRWKAQNLFSRIMCQIRGSSGVMQPFILPYHGKVMILALQMNGKIMLFSKRTHARRILFWD